MRSLFFSHIQNKEEMHIFVHFFFALILSALFVSEAWGEETMFDLYPDWEEDRMTISISATGNCSGIVNGLKVGEFIIVSDLNGYQVGSIPVDEQIAQNGFRMENISGGYRVTVYPDVSAVGLTDEDLQLWTDLFISSSMSPDDHWFITFPSRNMDGEIAISEERLAGGTLSFPIQVRKDGSEEILNGMDSVSGLAASTYLARIAPQMSTLASDWVEVTVEELSGKTVTITTVQEEKGLVSVFYGMTEESTEEKLVRTGDRIFPGELLRIRVIPSDSYSVTGVRFTVGEYSVLIGSEETENDFYTFEMPEENLTIEAVFTEKKTAESDISGDGENGNHEEDEISSGKDQELDEDSEKDDGSSDNPPKTFISDLIFSKTEDIISLTGGIRTYTYYTIPEEPDETSTFWSCDHPDVIRVQLDSERKQLIITPKKEGSAVITAVTGENSEVKASLTVTVVNDGSSYCTDFDRCYFTYMTEEGNWYYDYPTDFSVRCSGPNTMLEGIYIDGNYIPNYSPTGMNWSLSNTSDTAINFSSVFMSTLSHGRHTLTVTYTNGVSASKSFWSQSRYSYPKCGDESNFSLYIMYLCISAICLTEIMKKFRKNKDSFLL